MRKNYEKEEMWFEIDEKVLGYNHLAIKASGMKNSRKNLERIVEIKKKWKKNGTKWRKNWEKLDKMRKIEKNLE